MLTKVKSRLLLERKYFFTILTYLGLFSAVFCDSYEVSGHIYDSITNKPISGVNIIIGNLGTSTDEFGKFNIRINKRVSGKYGTRKEVKCYDGGVKSQYLTGNETKEITGVGEIAKKAQEIR